MAIASTTSAVLNYKGFVQSRTAENLQTTQTWQSTEQKLSSMIDNHTSGWWIGMSGTYGNLDKITFKQEEGPFWHADLQWNRPLSGGVIINIGDVSKPTESQLTISMIEMSLKTLPNYSPIWTYYFAERSDNTINYDMTDLLALSGAYRQQNDPTNTNKKVRWLRDKSQLPDSEWADAASGMVDWRILYDPTKMGIDYYLVPTYEITEYAKHSSKENAAWSMSTRSGKLKFPQNGDFGLEARYPTTLSGGRRWLCLGGDISFDGKYWIARCTYRWANDENGWDKDLYQEPSPQEGGYNSSYPLPNIMPQINN